MCGTVYLCVVCRTVYLSGLWLCITEIRPLTERVKVVLIWWWGRSGVGLK